MCKINLKPAASWEVFDVGYYVAEVDAIEPTMHEADKFHDDPYPQLKWKFLLHIPGRDDHPSSVAWTSISLNSKSKLIPLLQAFGITYGKDSFEIEDALGKFGRINIGEYTKSNGDRSNNVLGYAAYKGPALKTARVAGGQTGGTIQGTKPAQKAEMLPESEVPF